MAFPHPEVGLVISYSYLWRDEAEQGHVEGRKMRPCAIILALSQPEGRQPTVVVVPVTHSVPPHPDRAVEIPLRVKQHLGLDEARSWIMLDEVNVFTWPGFDLRPIATTYRYDYGLLPPKFIDQIREQFLKLVSSGLTAETLRDSSAD